MRSLPVAWVALVAVLLLLLVATRAPATAPAAHILDSPIPTPESDASPSTAPHSARQPSLDAAADQFGRLWAAGESSGLGDMVSESGVRLHLERSNRSPLPARQAVAALRDYFGGLRPGAARLGRVSEVGGVPARGFAEVIWEAAAEGTNETTTVTVYVGFVLEPDEDERESWQVDEIRIMPR